MNTSLYHKRALVCGASKGIGRAIAYELAELGASVILVARSESELKAVADDLPDSDDQHHEYRALDMMNIDDIESVVNSIIDKGPIHILINNTGGPAAGPLAEADVDDLVNGFKLHIASAQIITKKVLAGMKEDGYGRIINVISTSVKEPIKGLGVSNTIRGAMGNWSKTMAAELGQFGITVNNILPGFTATGRLDSIINGRMKKFNLSREDVENGMKAQVPLGRFADPSEVAQVAAFLASPAASYVNGINIPVDGGRTKSL